MNYTNIKIAVIGLAVSNTPLIRYLQGQGGQISVFDKKEPSALVQYLDQLQDLPLEFHFGADYLSHLHGFAYIFVTPGMRKDIPEFKQAKEEGAVFSSEMEVFF